MELNSRTLISASKLLGRVVVCGVFCDIGIFGFPTVVPPLQQNPTNAQAQDGSDRMQPSPDARLSRISDDSYSLESGSVLIHKYKPVHLRTPHAEIFVQKHAVALVTVDPSVTHVLDLYDWRVGSIKVSIGKRTKSLGPGAEASVVVADDQTQAQQYVLHDGFRRRRMKCTPLGDHHFYITDECSIIDAVLKQPLLGQLKNSASKSDRTVFDEIVKTAAAMSTTIEQEPYTVHE